MNLGALYQFTTSDNDVGLNADADAHVLGITADHKLTPKISVHGQVFHRKVDSNEANSTLLTVGLQHRLDRQLRMYTNVAVIIK